VNQLQDFAGTGTVLLAQSTILLAGIFLVVRQFRKRGPAAISLAYKAGLLGILAICALPLVPVHRSQPLIQVPPPPQTSLFSQPEPDSRNSAVSQSPKAVAPGPQIPEAAKPDSTPAFSAPEPIVSVSPTPRITVAAALLDLWLVGTSVLLAWILWAQVSLVLLRRRSVRLTQGLAFDRLQRLSAERKLPMPTLCVHGEATGPFLVGILRPTILIDRSVSDELDAASLDLIFEHELAHLRTHDCAWRLAERIVCALLWPQPLLWKLCQRLDHCSEELCDQIVIANSPSRKQYADCLLALANAQSNRRGGCSLVVGVVPFRSSIGKRIANIMDASQRGSTRISQGTRFGIAAVTSVLAIGTVMAVAGRLPLGQGQVHEFPFDKDSDPAAVSLFRQVQTAYKELNTFSVTVQAKQDSRRVTYVLDYKRPGLAVVHMIGDRVRNVNRILYVEPERVTSVWTDNPDIYEVSRKYEGKNLGIGWGSSTTGLMAMQHIAGLPTTSLAQFLEDVPLPKGSSAGKLTFGPDSEVDGEAVSTLVLHPAHGRWVASLTLLIGKADHLIRRFDLTQGQIDSTATSTVTESYSGIKINPKLDDSEFKFVPAPGAKEIPVYGAPRQAGKDVQALLWKVTQAYSNLKSLTFEVHGRRGRLIASLMQPAFARLSLRMNWDGREHDYMDSVSDGKYQYAWRGEGSKMYLRCPSSPATIGSFGGMGLPEGGFSPFIEMASLALGHQGVYQLPGDLALGPPGTVKGAPVDTIVGTMTVNGESGMPLKGSYSRHLYSFDKKSHLLVQVQTHDHTLMNGKVWDNQSTETVVQQSVNGPVGSFTFHSGAMTRADSLQKLSPIYDAETGIETGDLFPEIHASDMQGKPFSLAQYRGKVLLIHAWTLGVGNTETDLPTIEQLTRKYKDQGFEAVGIACDSRAGDEAFLKSKKIETRQLFDGQGVTKGFKDKLHIRRFPFAYLVDRHGKVFAKDPWIPDLEPILKKALAQGR
jgi:beta-lactamase regulating signal transducer with metallopeptidase domain/outer membrane lipoprotein-sorting protein/peroxiredoxin